MGPNHAAFGQPASLPRSDRRRRARAIRKARAALAPRRFAEPLERRTLLASVPVTLSVARFIELTNPDGAGGGDGDYYAEVKIGNHTEQSSQGRVSNPITGTDLTKPMNWIFTEYVDTADPFIPITLEVWDEDLATGDEQIDITGEAGSTLSFTYVLGEGLLQGHATGTAEDRGEVFFDVFVSTPVTVAITRFDQIDSPELGGGEGNYQFIAQVGDQTKDATGESITFPPGNYGEGFLFTGFVNPATTSVVDITVRVEDVDIATGNEVMDISPNAGERDLHLKYNLTSNTWFEASGAFNFPQNFSQGAGGEDDRGKVFFNISPGVDTDGDGLFDIWEEHGIDANSDGVIDLVLATDPERKDIFVEIDAMTSFVPEAGALADVAAAFANAPVDNPDGSTGINLHLMLDETNIPDAYWTGPNGIFPVEFDQIKQNTNPNVAGGFGTVADRAHPDAAAILDAKALVNHYAIFANHYGSNNSGGIAELPGNDLLITLGAIAGGSREEQAGTLMHELGHNLGLAHGGPIGPDNVRLPNFKPNYHSLMNYVWSYRYYLGAAPTPDETAFANSWILDYSRDPFDTLDENSLSESGGIGGHPGHVTQIGPVYDTAGNYLGPRFVAESGPADWNGNGAIGGNVASDVNFFGDVNGDGLVTAADASPGETHEGQDDWAGLIYNFRFSIGFADGTHPEVEDDPFDVELLQDLNEMLYYGAPTDGVADDLVLRRNGDVLEVFDNNAGQVVESRAIDDTRLIHIRGADGESDTLTIDFSFGGFFTVPGGIEFLGGDAAGSDLLRVIAPDGATSTYAPSATTPGSGTVTVASGGDGALITFTGLEPVELTGGVAVNFATPNGEDDLTVAGATASGGEDAVAVSGTSGGVAFETLVVFDVGALNVDAAFNDGAGTGEDAVSIDLGAADPAVPQLTLVTGDGADLVDLLAAPFTDLSVDLGGGDDALTVDGEALTFDVDATTFTTATRETVAYAGVEELRLTEGRFQATGTIPASTDVVVLGGATLGGTGDVQGDVTVQSAGSVDPGVGAPAPGLLRAGTTTFASTASFHVDLNGLAAGTGHDQLVTGEVHLNNATLTGTLGFNAIPGDEIVIVRVAGTGTVTGQFAQGGIVTIGGDKFAIDYAYDADGDGRFNDVALLRYGAELAPDPCDPSKQALFVSATTGDDVIRFVPATGNARTTVLINGVDEGTFKPSGLLIAFGQSGDDEIRVEMPARQAWLFGQGGDDVLRSGNQDGLLHGGLGDDELWGGNGKDVLVGGPGADRLRAGNGTDLLIAGSTAYDANTAANRDVWCHIFHDGMGSGLLTPGTTVFNDTSVDDLLGGNGKDTLLLNVTGAGPRDTSDLAKNELAIDL